MHPEDSVVDRLEDVSRMDVAATIIPETQVESDTARRPPSAFLLEYDSSKMLEGMSYRIRAVDKEGKLPWITDTHTLVLTRGGPSDPSETPCKMNEYVTLDINQVCR